MHELIVSPDLQRPFLSLLDIVSVLASSIAQLLFFSLLQLVLQPRLVADGEVIVHLLGELLTCGIAARDLKRALLSPPDLLEYGTHITA